MKRTPAGVHGALLLVQLLFSSLAIAGKFVLGEVPASVLVLARVAGAALVLAAAHRLAGGTRVVAGRDLLRLAWLGLLGIAANQLLFLLGLSHTTAINASVLVATAPVFTVLNGIAFRTERATPLKVGGIALAAAGAVWLVAPGRWSFGSATALGDLFILAGMYAYSHYLVLGKGMVRKYGAVTVTTYAMGFAALGMIPFGLPAALHLDWGAVRPATWTWVAYIVAGPTVATYFLNLWALRRASSNLVAAYIYLQPVFTAAVAPFVLAGEGLTPATLLGAAGIFAGLGCVILGEGRSGAGIAPLPIEPA
jgi:drug/metabolite transporter (DMT)-like permease